jgi:hypothetical protein
MTSTQYATTREYMTTDGRDLSREEWRRIPGFPVYEITEDGDVRNIRSGRIVKEIENKITGAYFYSIRDKDGKARNRSYQSLVKLAFCEPDRPEEDWKIIPNYSSYQVTRDGEVRNARTKKKVMTEALAKYRWEKTVRLRQDGINFRTQVRKLIDQAWPMWSEEEEVA